MKQNIDYIFTRVRDTLQDKQKSRWVDRELFRYLDEAMRDYAIQTKYKLEVEEFDILPTQTDYSLRNEVIDYYKITSPGEYIVVDSKTIRIPDPKDGVLRVEYYSYPDRIIYGATLEIDMDEDAYDALESYVVYKAYQKEDRAESIAKAEYFKNQYASQVVRHMVKYHGIFDVESSRTDFYR